MRGKSRFLQGAAIDGAVLDEYVGERDLYGRFVVVKVVSVVAAGLILAALVWWTVRGGGDAAGPEPAAVKTLAVPVEEATESGLDSPPAIARSVPPLWRTLGERPSDLDPPPYMEGWSEAGRVLLDVSQAVAPANVAGRGSDRRRDTPARGVLRGSDRPGKHRARLRFGSARRLATDADGPSRRLVVAAGRLEEAERTWQRSSLPSRETQQ